MCLLDKNDLYKIVKEKEVFDLFNLMERERSIVMMHAKGFTFEIIAGIEKVTTSRVHQLYQRALKKMRKQLMQMLKEKSAQSQLAKRFKGIFIGGDGEVCDREFGNGAYHSSLAVGF